MKLEEIRRSFDTSLKGKGPHRPIPQSKVQVGDIAVFRVGRPIPGLPDRIVHSAVVIRVSGGEIELFEKTDPHQPAATRTVTAVLAHYRKDAATVHFLAPALEGLPGEAKGGLGKTPPTEPYTEARGKAPEDTHVLFALDRDTLLPHEDTKLFSFLAKHKTSVSAKVHGYASLEGPPTYNLNLSAHRAIAVRKGLERQLPAGSTVEAFAHGETDAFGPEPENRRAGIEET